MSATSTQKSKRTRRRHAVVRPAVVRPATLVLVAVMASVALPPRALTATAPEPARVRVAATLVDDVVRRLLPLDVVLAAPLVGPGDAGAPPPASPSTATVTELRYCGLTDKGNGRWRAVLRSGSGAGAEAAVLADDDACRQTLGDLNRRFAEGRERDDGIGIADVEAVWRPWELHLVIARLIGVGPTKPGGPHPLAVIESRRELVVISTANVRVVADSGDVLTFHAAPSFASDGIDLLVVLGENGAGPPAGRPPAAGRAVALSAGMNVGVDLPFGFANQVFRQLTATRPMAVPVDRDVIDVQNVATTWVNGGLTVTGVATPRSLRETVRLTVQAGGDEVRVSSVRADAQLENCVGMGTLAGIACSTRNAGRGAAAAALGAALTQRYQGQPVRDLAGSQTMRFDLAGHRLEMPGDLLHVTAGTRGVWVGAHFGASGGAGH